MPQETLLAALLSFAAGALIAALIVHLLRRRTIARLGTELTTASTALKAEAEQRQRTDAELEEEQNTVRELDRRLAVAEERSKVFQEARQELENSFAALANRALRGNADQFLTLASEKLGAKQTEANAALDERKLAIETLLQPLRDGLERLDQRTGELEKSRVDAYSRLDQQVRQLAQATEALHSKTTSLTTALKGSRIGGRWGEIALRNVAELAGMTRHCDFEEQLTLDSGGRPDMTVNLPGGRKIAVDAKAPLNAYMEAAEAKDPKARGSALDRHVKALRSHVRNLADRRYAEALGKDVDLVVLFLPGDPFLSAAFEQDPQLQVEALRQKVLLATPTTLVALLRTVAIYWQQSAMVENAEAIAETARQLYDRAAKFSGDLDRIGGGLRAALKAYNQAVGSFDRRLLPMGKRLEGMRIAEQRRRPLAGPQPIDEPVRRPASAKTDDEPPND